MNEEIAAAGLADMDHVLATAVSELSVADSYFRFTLYKTCIDRWAPKASQYARMVEYLMPMKEHSGDQLRGVLVALRRDYSRGMVSTFEQLVHASLFDDLLAQAEYLLVEGGFILPAAVITGAALEEHLRKLAGLHGIAITKQARSGDTVPKAASEVNDDLHKANALPQTQWRLNQAWIDLRNQAAHGKPEFQAKTREDIKRMVDGVRDVVTRYPA